ncbi:MAG: hypothetical protein SOZ59_05995 [Candidatus Limivivens sp.]|nr:hypothetical protein [Candidatus Limivivens sp.]
MKSTCIFLRLREAEVEAIRPRLNFNGEWLPTHLMNHEVKKRVTGGKHRVIYHANC